MTNKERYATVGTWAEVFQKEGHSISGGGIKYKMEKAGIIGETARNRMGRVLRESFYAESDVRRVCSSLLVNLPQSNEEGIILQDGVEYALPRTWLSKLDSKIDARTLIRRLEDAGCESISGLDRRRARRNGFYSKGDVLSVTLSDTPHRLNEEGHVAIEGATYYSVKALSKQTGVPIAAIQIFSKKHELPHLMAKDDFGHPIRVYSIGQIDSLLKRFPKGLPRAVRKTRSEAERAKARSRRGLRARLPRAVRSGYLDLDGKVFRTLRGWEAVLNVPYTRLRSGLQGVKAEAVQGMSAGGRVSDFFSEDDVQQALADYKVPDFPLDTAYFYNTGYLRADLESFALELGDDKTPLDLGLGTFRKASITCQNGQVVKGESYLHYAAIAFGFAEDTESASSKQAQTLRCLLKTAGFDIFDEDYFKDSEKVRADLRSFAKQLGEDKTPFGLSTHSIQSLCIRCQNGQEMRGYAYLHTAAKALGFARTVKEANSKLSFTLRTLKEIAGYLTDSND